MSEKTVQVESTPHSSSVSGHYDEKYFAWQREVGEFGGKANSFKYLKTVKPTDVVIDFGCGGGFLLKNLECARRIGLEPNASASGQIAANGVEHFLSPRAAIEALGEEIADVITSNNALEHTLNPLQEIKDLMPLLKIGGLIHFVVPCDSIRYSYKPKDINYHLFSWSPMNLGNLFTEAGYEIVFARPYMHHWPPYYRFFAKLGWPTFNLISRIYSRLWLKWGQSEVLARRIS